MSQPNDPYKTQPLAPLTEKLAQPVRLPLAALVALAVAPTVILGALLLAWSRPVSGLRSPVSGLPSPVSLLPSPTPSLLVSLSPGLRSPASGLPAAQALPRAVVAYAAPGGVVIGALEQGRAYHVVARSGLEWVQLDVALPGEAANLVWVRAGEVPELSAAAGLADLATPLPTPAPEVVYVAAEPAAAPAPAVELAPLLAEPTPAYVVAPPAAAPRSVVLVAYPTPTPCSIRDLGLSLNVCNGYVR